MFENVSLLSVIVCLYAVLAVAGPAPQAGPCEGASGVTVAVDLNGAGRSEVFVRCVPGSPGNAMTALERSGLAVRAGTGTGPYGESGYVCRVEGLPSADSCTGHRDGAPYWKIWRVGMDPVAWRASGTDGGPGAVAVCPGGLVGFSFGDGASGMSVGPERVVTAPGWLPPSC